MWSQEAAVLTPAFCFALTSSGTGLLRHTDQMPPALVGSRHCIRKPAGPQFFLRFLGWRRSQDFRYCPGVIRWILTTEPFLHKQKNHSLEWLEATVLPLALQVTTEFSLLSVSIITSFWFRNQSLTQPGEDGRLSMSLLVASRVTRFLCLWSHGETGCLGMKSIPVTSLSTTSEPSLSCISWLCLD